MKLTSAQLVTVNKGHAPGTVLSIQSGPGCGKSLCISKRIESLLANGVKADEIIVLSLTNRAVNSLRNTIYNSFGSVANDLVIKTFHSFASMLLEDNGAEYHAGKPPYSVLDDASWRSFADFFNAKPKILEQATLEVKDGASLEAIAEKYAIPVKRFREIVDYMDQNGLVRYLGLISAAIELLDKSDGKLNTIANAKVLIIDEFQDMQPSLLPFITKIAKHGIPKHITLAGDKNQCIYEFLGSRPSITEEFIKQLGFPVDRVYLKESFRLTPEILESANAIIPTEIRSMKNTGVKTVGQGNICTDIVELIALSGGILKFSDFMILVRSNAEVDTISEMLTKEYGIKCNKYNGLGWANSDIHLFLDILHVLNKSYGSDFALLLMLKKFGMGKREVKKIFTNYKKWNKSSHNKLENFLKLTLEDARFQEFLNLLEQERLGLDTPITIMGSLARITKKWNFFAQDKDLQQNLTDFYSSLKIAHTNYLLDSRANSNSTFLEYFLRHYFDAEPILDHDAVNVSTVHKAKGLEFPVVFVPNNGRMKLGESRLKYVALTRAKNFLYIGGERGEKNLDTIQEYMKHVAVDLNRAIPSTKSFNAGKHLLNLYRKVLV
ncbi:ATP-dependent helicase [Acetobacter pasteurianus]|nr:ATP-dependent helicase [Acetobacter pasteurianus]